MAPSADNLILVLYGLGLLLLGFMVGYAAGSYRSLHRNRGRLPLR